MVCADKQKGCHSTGTATVQEKTEGLIVNFTPGSPMFGQGRTSHRSNDRNLSWLENDIITMKKEIRYADFFLAQNIEKDDRGSWPRKSVVRSSVSCNRVRNPAGGSVRIRLRQAATRNPRTEYAACPSTSPLAMIQKGARTATTKAFMAELFRLLKSKHHGQDYLDKYVDRGRSVTRFFAHDTDKIEARAQVMAQQQQISNRKGWGAVWKAGKAKGKGPRNR